MSVPELILAGLLGAFVLIIPGFLLTLVVYPKVGSLDFWERIAVSLGFGTLVVIYIGVILAKPEWKMLRLWPFAGGVLLFCIVCGIVAYLRGGMEVVVAYKRTVVRGISKLRPPRPKPAPPEELPPEEKPPEEKPPEKPEGGESV
jgi:uncharacterized membrane protein